ncbi:SurA N-terminal domain-containing protein, partial [Ruegeria sp. NA]
MAAGAKSLSKTFVWILMGMLMLGLAGFGAVNLSGTVRTVAQVGDESISIDDFVRELQREIRAVEAQSGQPLQMSQARDLGLDRNALARLTALAALDNEVSQLGISIGDENLQKEIVSVPAFQGVDGSFDREAYRFQLEQVGMTDSEFETDLRKESARTIVQGAIMGGVEMPA